MADNLKKKQNVRKGHILHVRRLIKQFDEIKIEPTESIDKNKVKTIKLTVQAKQSLISNLSDDVWGLLEEEDALEKDMDEMNKFTDETNYFITSIDDFVSTNFQPQRSSESTISANSATSENRVRLPKISIQPFDGNELNWRPFWDQFNSTIHNNPTLNEIDKFCYLKNLICPSALECIKGLSLTEGNYNTAVTTLKGRFGNTQVLISRYMDVFVKIEKVKSLHETTKLRKLFDSVENSLLNLKELGVETETYGTLLINILFDRLPEGLKIIITRECSDSHWKLDNIMRVFKNELNARERCSQLGSNPTPNPSHRPPASTFTGNTSASNSPKCVFCRLSHASSKCNKVTDVHARTNILRKAARCFLCLQQGHRQSECQSRYKCNQCNKRHHISICLSREYRPTENTVENPPETDQGGVTTSTTGTTTTTSVYKNSILLQTATAHVSDVENQENATARIMFDTGSQRSYITEKLRDSLKLKTVKQERMIINSFGQSDSVAKNFDIVKIRVRADDEFRDIEAICVPEISKPLRNQNFDFATTAEPELKTLKIADYGSGNQDMCIEMLIGVDYYYSFFKAGNVKQFKTITAIESIFGWVLCGSIENSTKELETSSYHNTTYLLRVNCFSEMKREFEKQTEKHDAKKLFNEMKLNSEADEENEVLKTFKENISLNEGETRYTVPLPEKPHHELLPDNYNISMSRLLSLKRKLEANPDLLNEYDEIIESYLQEGIIEHAPNEIIDTGKVHYLAHRAVVKEDRETTKVRIVFDASSKTGNNPSLNDCLYSGPCMLPKIPSILSRFRMGKVGLVADIKQAFLNVEVDSEYRDLLRFLWFDRSGKIITYRFTRLVMGLTSSPFSLAATINKHIETLINKDIDTAMLTKFLQDLYVDDETTSVNSTAEGYEFYKQSKEHMRTAGFVLRKWETNDKTLKKRIDLEENVESGVESKVEGDEDSFAKLELGVDKKYKKVLGVSWDVDSDELVFEFEKLCVQASELKATKRNILKITASFFDPVGYISPIVLRGKLLFQMCCTESLGWDDEVTGLILREWKLFLKELKGISSIRIPRFLFSSLEILHIELHGFSDAAKSAYAACVYLRVVTADKIVCNLVASKSNLASVKMRSVPRLELLGCLSLSELLIEVVDWLKLDCVIHCWSDSGDALCWIKNVRKEWNPWVENRVNEIRTKTPIGQWRHVPGIINPADLATKKKRLAKVKEEELWLHGPEFLRVKDAEWPEQKPIPESPEALIEEKRKRATTNLAVNVETANLHNIIDVTRFSTYHKLLRVTAYVKKFIQVLRNPKQKFDTELSTKDLRAAELQWLKDDQSLSTFQENQMNLFVDKDGIKRSRTRLVEAGLPYEVSHPIVLKGSRPLSNLIIRHHHQKVKHLGVESTLSSIRSEFWITRARQNAKRIVSRCVTCKLRHGRTMKPRREGNLPNERICSDFPFETTGVDYAGPFYVRDIYSTSVDMNKCYLLLFTCATSRAVHLELTPDLGHVALIRALRRFFSRRGVSTLIISDNFKSFKAQTVKNFITANNISWEFIVELSPWWGGFYERIVKVVKDTLYKVIGNASLHYEELNTVLCEIESVINSRPLTYVSDDIDSEPITPSHLLHGRTITNVNRESKPVVQLNGDDIRNRLKYLENVMRHYWNRFYHEYTVALRERMIYDKRNRSDVPVSVGEIVLIKDDKKTPRSKWKKGKIERTLPSRDGVVRAVELKVSGTKGTTSLLKRAVERLIPLEVKNKIEHVNNNEVQPTRTRRNAAIIGELRRKEKS